VEANKLANLAEEGKDSVHMNFNANWRGTVDRTAYRTRHPQEQDQAVVFSFLRELRVLRGERVLLSV